MGRKTRIIAQAARHWGTVLGRSTAGVREAMKRPEHITVMNVGSRDDVHPFIALGEGLQRAGHKVTVATHSGYEAKVRERGMDFRPIFSPQSTGLADLLCSLEVKAAGRNPIKRIAAALQLTEKYHRRLRSDIVRACDGAEALVLSPPAQTAFHIAEQRQIPAIIGNVQPAYRTSEFPHFLMPNWLRFGRSFNHLSYVALEQAMYQTYRRGTNSWRTRKLGLDPLPMAGPQALVEKYKPLMLFGHSAALIPRPSDWPEHCYVTGYWWLDTEAYFDPSADLMRFIGAGDPPVLICLGDHAKKQTNRILREITDAVRKSERRSIVITNDDRVELGQLQGDIFMTDFISFDWILPRISAFVHYAGAETTFLGLRSGIPTVAVPFHFDQRLWAESVRRQGASPTPLRPKRLTADKLVKALDHAINDPSLVRRREEIKDAIAKEDGVRDAVALIEKRLERQGGP